MHAFFLRILSCHCQDIWGMDVRLEDGDGLTTDPVPMAIRSSHDFQKAFLALRSETLKTLGSFKAMMLHHLALDQGIQVKGKQYKYLMAVLTKYVIPPVYIV
jgi:hypothetical protein